MRSVAATLAILLDKSAALGVGLVDAHGLLLAAQGLHGGQQASAVAALLAAAQPSGLEELLSDAFSEQVVLGERYCFYLHWLPARNHFLYAMAERERAHGRVRQALKDALGEVVEGLAPSAVAEGQRLKEPRQFPRGTLVR
jgi:hypothetical protein